MRDKILALAKGKYQYQTAKLQLSEKQLRLVVVSGHKGSTSFEITNNCNTKVKGYIIDDGWNFHYESVFFDEKAVVEITYDAKEDTAGATREGEFTIVSDCGEEKLPYCIEIVSPTLQDESGKITDYYVLQNRIQNDISAGEALFHSETFREVFLYRDEVGQALYDHLVKRNTRLQSMEEFLVTEGKKERVQFSLDRTELTYQMNGEEKEDSLLLSVNTWGSQEIRIYTEASFLSIPKPVLHTEEFIGNGTMVNIVLHTAGLKNGKYEGCITFESMYQRVEVSVCVRVDDGRTEWKKNVKDSKYFWALCRTYLNQKLGQMNEAEYKKNMNLIIEKLSEYDVPWMKGVRAYVYALNEQKELLAELLEEEPEKRPDALGSLGEILSYLLYQYAMCVIKEKPDYTAVVSDLHYYYENGCRQAEILYLLIQLDERYQAMTPELRFQEIMEFLYKGVASPFLYMEASKCIRQDATLVHELDEVSLRVVYWGIREDMFGEEFALQLGFLAEHVHTFSPLLYRSLAIQYERYHLEDTLHSICSLLIRCGMWEQTYFSWFERGVKGQLRITELYEYYMYSMSKENQERDRIKGDVIPQVVISFFQYENHLNEKVKAFLFAKIVRERKEKPENFRNFQESIREFVQKQLELGHISKDLGLLYDYMITAASVKDSMVELLPQVMFKQQVTCDTPRMEGVVVTHLETQKEEYYSLSGGVAYVDIHTPNHQIYFVDDEGRYHVGTVSFTLEELSNLKRHALLCFEKGATSPGLMLYLFANINHGYRMKQQDALICHMVQNEGKLQPICKGRNLVMLFKHYAQAKDREMMLHVLTEIDLAYVKKENISELVNAMAEYGLYDKAYQEIRRRGPGICVDAELNKIVNEMIQKYKDKRSTKLVKICFALYKKGYVTESILQYLMTFYMGPVEEMNYICRRAIKEDTMIPDDFLERILGQVLFVGKNPEAYSDLFLYYHKNGTNRILAKAYLGYLAYEYITEQCDISDEVHDLMARESTFDGNDILLLAILRKMSFVKELSKQQCEYIDIHLSRFAKDGIIMKFMQRFEGKLSLPYNVENAVIVQYFATTKLPINVLDGKQIYPMREILPGIYIKEFLLFEGEEKHVVVCMEETGKKTKTIVLKRKEHGERDNSFYDIVNHMLTCAKKGNDEEKRQIANEYMRHIHVAEKLFKPL